MAPFAGRDISVVIPTHDRPDALVRAARSVANQTASVGELVVVNDGSEHDYTAAKETLRSLSTSTSFLETDGIGAAAARNLGAERAGGDVLMFLDDDDRWRPEKAARQLDRLTEGIGLVYSGRIAVDSSGNELYRIDGGETGDLSRAVLLANPIGTTSGPAIRATEFDAVGGFDERMPGLQDWELWIRLSQATRVAYDPRHTVEWTVHDEPGAQMTSQGERYVEAMERLVTKHAERFDRLSWVERRKARAYRNVSLAKKYPPERRRARYTYVLASLLQWPSLRAAVRLLPPDLVVTLRRFTRS